MFLGLEASLNSGGMFLLVVQLYSQKSKLLVIAPLYMPLKLTATSSSIHPSQVMLAKQSLQALLNLVLVPLFQQTVQIQ